MAERYETDKEKRPLCSNGKVRRRVEEGTGVGSAWNAITPTASSAFFSSMAYLAHPTDNRLSLQPYPLSSWPD